MISESVLEEILYLSSRNKVLDKKTILKIALEILNNLDSYILNKFNGIVFEKQSNFNKYSYAALNKSSGKIKIYLEEIQKRNFSSILETNLMIVESLIHEFKHLEESKRILNGNFESLLIMASDNNVIYESLIKNKSVELLLPQCVKEAIFLNYYCKIYNIIPAERIADIEAYNILLKSIEKYPNFKKDYIKEYSSIKEKMMISYLSGYRFNGTNYSIPLIEYFKKIDDIDTLSVFDFYKKDSKEFLESSKRYFSLEERFKYGLPINDGDKEKIIRKCLVTSSDK